MIAKLMWYVWLVDRLKFPRMSTDDAESHRPLGVVDADHQRPADCNSLEIACQASQKEAKMQDPPCYQN